MNKVHMECVCVGGCLLETSYESGTVQRTFLDIILFNLHCKSTTEEVRAPFFQVRS